MAFLARAPICLLPALALACGLACQGQVKQTGFEVVGSIPVPAGGGLWDYAAIDPASRRLFLSDDGVMALDLATRDATPRLMPGGITHGVLPLGNGTAAVADGSRHEVEIFDERSGRMLRKVETGDPGGKVDLHNPDAVLLEPKTGRLIAVNGDSGSLVLINLQKNVVDGVIRVGGELEFAVSSGKGIVYVNVASQNEVAAIDVLKRRVIRRFPLEGCEEPTGLAYDAQYHLVVSACSNGVAEFVNAGGGSVAAQIAIGKGCDAVLLDAKRGFAFFPGGDSGTLSVVTIRGPRDIRVVQTVATAVGARLGAVDPATGTLYLPVVAYDRDAPPIRLAGLPPLPRPVAGSFRFLIVARSAR